MTQSTSTEVRDVIVAANENFMAAFNKGDAAGLAALYTENGQLLPPNSDFLTGRQAIQTFWQGLMDMGIKSAKLEIVEVEGHGDTAIEVSKYTLQGEGGRCSTRASTWSFFIVAPLQGRAARQSVPSRTLNNACPVRAKIHPGETALVAVFAFRPPPHKSRQAGPSKHPISPLYSPRCCITPAP